MTRAELRTLFAELLGNEKFVAFLKDLDARFGAHHRTTFVPGDPYATAYNEGARSVIVFINRLAEEAVSSGGEVNDRGEFD